VPVLMTTRRERRVALEGHCPVRLRDHRTLVRGDSAFQAEHDGVTYRLCSAEALEKFSSEPEKYVPAFDNCDIVQMVKTGDHREGSVAHAVWYQERLYLFDSAETQRAFIASPAEYAVVR
jgi:YHS domain-containing protein